MRNSNFLIGKWKGNYRYLHNQSLNKIGLFTMEITEVTGEKFLGIITDDTEHKAAYIKGNLIGSQIEFIKTYYTIDLLLEGKKLTTVEYKHFIKYESSIINSKEMFGTWFRGEQEVSYNGKKYVAASEQGSWSVSKIID